MRFIVLVVLVVLAVWLIRRALRGPVQKADLQKRTEAVGELVRCAHCGVHLPRSEARQAAGRLYCSEEHARLGMR
jgi:uncharacterized protein